MKNFKKLTLLHSNDMHGDFSSEKLEDKLVGGVSQLSGYIQKVRREEPNVLYAVAGDMFCGSLIDSEYRGISTIELMNILTPDVVTLGNHEVDYGIAHLLFLEKCARFPIINANIYIKNNHVRLFRSHLIKEIDGMKILFIGILTQEVLSQTKKETLVGTLVDVREAADEVGKICNSYQTEDVDLTILLTHIGFEADKELAEILDPAYGVDLIIGGHTHTLLEEPCVVAGIPIVQAACGTDQIGRFDLVIDTDTNSLDSYEWQLIPIDDEHCPSDPAIEKVLRGYEDETEEKYGRFITRFADKYEHPVRNRETELGRLYADLFRQGLDLDIMLVGSGFIRSKEMGPIITYRDVVQCFPFDEAVYRVTVNGEQLKRMIRHIFREESFAEEAHTEFYQFSKGLSFAVHLDSHEITNILFDGKHIDDKKLFDVGMHAFHFASMDEFLGITREETDKNKRARMVTTCTQDVLIEWLSQEEMLTAPQDRRWVTV